MFRFVKATRAFVVPFALLVTAGCAETASQPPQTAATRAPAPVSATAPSANAPSPELAGAWYQIQFDTNSLAIDPRGQMIVKNVAYVVANTDTTRVTVIGRTDRVGSAASNQTLSQRRAAAVRDALVAAGVPSARIDTSWTGEGMQDVATADDVAAPRNRVVDITVVKQAM